MHHHILQLLRANALESFACWQVCSGILCSLAGVGGIIALLEGGHTWTSHGGKDFEFLTFRMENIISMIISKGKIVLAFFIFHFYFFYYKEFRSLLFLQEA